MDARNPTECCLSLVVIMLDYTPVAEYLLVAIAASVGGYMKS